MIGQSQLLPTDAETSAETILQLRRQVAELQRELDEVTLYAAQLRATPLGGSVYDLPGTLRRLRHERGWSQGQLVARLEHLAGERAIWLPARDTLRIYLSRWENGHAKPSGIYHELLDAVFARPSLYPRPGGRGQ